jgi:hypothetical protein
MRSMPPEKSSVPNSWPPNILSPTTNDIASGRNAARATEGESRRDPRGGATEDSRRSPPTSGSRPFGFFSEVSLARARGWRRGRSLAPGDSKCARGDSAARACARGVPSRPPPERARAAMPRAVLGIFLTWSAHARIHESKKKWTACLSLDGGICDCS